MDANLGGLKVIYTLKVPFVILGLVTSLVACNDANDNVAILDSARVEQLAAAVEQAEDMRAIKKLQRSYGYYLDKGMWTDLAEYFTEDAIVNYPAGVYQGKESITEHLYRNVGGVEMGQVGLGDNRLYNHMNIQPVVHLGSSGDTAKGRWRAMAMFGRFGRGPGIWAEGIYNMTYAKENGVWKISGLQYHSGFGAPYTQGWGNLNTEPRDTSNRVLPHMPDVERNMPCDGFPAACIVPFHYENLGTSDDGHAWMGLASLPVSDAADDQQVRVSDLLHRAQLLRDEQDVENLQRVYGYYLDRKMWDELAELFAQDGSIEMAQRGVYKGKSRVREFLNLLGDAGLKQGELNDHMQLQTIVDVGADGLTAKARSREWNMIGVHHESGQWSAGLYENTYVKEDGVWKFQSLHYYPTFITDYDQGWTLDAQAAPAISSVLPPDFPPTEVYEMYPKAHIPAYHYVNPVTGKVSTYPETSGAPQGTIDLALEQKVDFKPALVTNMEQALAEAEALVQNVKDRHEIENLENAYGYYLDKNLWNELADLFAEEGSMELAQRGVYSGRERVRGFLFNVFGNEGPVEGRLGNHLHMQSVIDVAEDGQSALVRSRMMQQLSFSGRPSMGAAIYANELVKEEGRWKFKSTHAFNTWSAGYAGGWKEASDKPRVPGPSEAYPPDMPPTFEFSMFPDIYEIPFHY